MSGGDQNNESRNTSEITPVHTLTIMHPMPTSNTLVSSPVPAISPSVLAAKQKDEEKKIQLVMVFCCLKDLKENMDPSCFKKQHFL